MSNHRAPRARTSGRVRPSTLGLLAAAITPLAGFGIAAPALAQTTAPDAANAAGLALGLPGLPGDQPAQPVVDVDIPDVCLDLSAEVDRLQNILTGAGDDASEAQRAAVANAKLALGTCVDNATDQTPDPTGPTTTPSPSTGPTTTLPPLGPPLAGGGQPPTSSTDKIPANADGESQAERQGSNTQVTIPRGAADTGDGSF